MILMTVTADSTKAEGEAQPSSTTLACPPAIPTHTLPAFAPCSRTSTLVLSGLAGMRPAFAHQGPAAPPAPPACVQTPRGPMRSVPAFSCSRERNGGMNARDVDGAGRLTSCVCVCVHTYLCEELGPP